MFQISTVLVVLLFSFSTYAQLLDDETPVIVQRQSEQVVEDSSEFNRIGKKYELSFSPFGSGPVPGINSGVNAAFYLKRNISVMANYSKLQTGSYNCSGSVDCKEDGKSFGIYLRQFVSNSFYYLVGVDQRHVEYSETDHFFNTSYGFTGDTTALGILIGNQWQWRSLIIGCDWIGFSVPLVYSYSSTGDESNSLRGSSTVDNLVKNVLEMGLRFRIGIAF
ncbi:MAG: hypothetical protein ACKOX6_08070 [Bdellovibrio sp.]